MRHMPPFPSAKRISLQDRCGRALAVLVLFDAGRSREVYPMSTLGHLVTNHPPQCDCGYCRDPETGKQYPVYTFTWDPNVPLDFEWPPVSPRTGETPQEILDRLALELGCEPRQVCDRVIAILEERRKNASH